MHPHRYKITQERDKAILLALWKWKLLTTAAISVRFFPSRDPSRAYNRLLALKGHGLIDQRSDERGINHHWTLTKSGYASIRSSLSDLKEDGFRTENPEHDAIVTAFHLGDWLLNPPDQVRFFSEQQLRRLELREYPEWVPKTENHRTDGYWGIPNNRSVTPIAIEVELARKSNREYEDIGYFYDEQEKVHRVLWVVLTKATADRIQANIDKAARRRARIHDFVILDDFRNQCWDALIFQGPDANHTVIGLLTRLAGLPNNSSANHARISAPPPVLDARKSYVKSNTTPLVSVPSEVRLARISTAIGT